MNFQEPQLVACLYKLEEEGDWYLGMAYCVSQDEVKIFDSDMDVVDDVDDVFAYILYPDAACISMDKMFDMLQEIDDDELAQMEVYYSNIEY